MTRAGSDATTGDAPPRRPPAATSPTLAVDGFEGPLDWLLALARAGKVDFARLSILALVEAFAGAMEAALNRLPGALAPDLAQWAAWTVTAAQLAELRSRLLRPTDALEARTAQAEVEALRRQWLRRAAMAAAADWLERRPQLGRDVFARGQPDAGKAGGDLTDLLRACLVALRLPPRAEAFQPRRPPFWDVGDAAARITRLLQERPRGGMLGAFLPKVAETGPGHAPQGRAAVAATFVARLELARGCALAMDQDGPWQTVRLAIPVR